MLLVWLSSCFMWFMSSSNYAPAYCSHTILRISEFSIFSDSMTYYGREYIEYPKGELWLNSSCGRNNNMTNTGKTWERSCPDEPRPYVKLSAECSFILRPSHEFYTEIDDALNCLSSYFEPITYTRISYQLSVDLMTNYTFSYTFSLNRSVYCVVTGCTDRVPDLYGPGTGCYSACKPPCFQQIDRNTGELRNACDVSCPFPFMTESIDGKCVLKPCENRMPNVTHTEAPCGPSCYQQLNTETGILLNDCRSTCGDSPHVVKDGSRVCVLKECPDRKPATVTADAGLSCGSNCYQQLSPFGNGTTHRSECTVSCAGNLTTGGLNGLHGQCVLKERCADRVPDALFEYHCGSTACLEQPEGVTPRCSTACPPATQTGFVSEPIKGTCVVRADAGGNETKNDTNDETGDDTVDDGKKYKIVIAIVVSVVGGVIAVCAIVIGIICAVRRRKTGSVEVVEAEMDESGRVGAGVGGEGVDGDASEDARISSTKESAARRSSQRNSRRSSRRSSHRSSRISTRTSQRESTRKSAKKSIRKSRRKTVVKK